MIGFSQQPYFHFLNVFQMDLLHNPCVFYRASRDYYLLLFTIDLGSKWAAIILCCNY